jgi:NAD(P)-dependent dehydrogenase (short-subunit alcohol dehydrogenase family)
MKVKDKVCVVTGAAGGIGEAIARRYAKEGAKGVVIADRDAGRLEVRRQGHQGHRRRLRRRQGGGCPPSDRGREKHYGPVDVFFSNAGIGRGGHEDATDQDGPTAGRSMSWPMSTPPARSCRACWSASPAIC